MTEQGYGEWPKLRNKPCTNWMYSHGIRLLKLNKIQSSLSIHLDMLYSRGMCICIGIVYRVYRKKTNMLRIYTILICYKTVSDLNIYVSALYTPLCTNSLKLSYSQLVTLNTTLRGTFRNSSEQEQIAYRPKHPLCMIFTYLYQEENWIFSTGLLKPMK